MLVAAELLLILTIAGDGAGRRMGERDGRGLRRCWWCRSVCMLVAVLLMAAANGIGKSGWGDRAIMVLESVLIVEPWRSPALPLSQSQPSPGHP